MQVWKDTAKGSLGGTRAVGWNHAVLSSEGGPIFLKRASTALPPAWIASPDGQHPVPIRLSGAARFWEAGGQETASRVSAGASSTPSARQSQSQLSHPAPVITSPGSIVPPQCLGGLGPLPQPVANAAFGCDDWEAALDLGRRLPWWPRTAVPPARVRATLHCRVSSCRGWGQQGLGWLPLVPWIGTASPDPGLPACLHGGQQH